MNKELLNYSIEELEYAISLKRLKESREIKLSDGTLVILIDENQQIVIQDSEFDVTSFPVNKDNIAKLKLFINSFDDNANWIY
jgi:hypothetical protein